MPLYGSRIGQRLVEAHQLPPEGEDGSPELVSFLNNFEVDNDGAGGLLIHAFGSTLPVPAEYWVVRLPDGNGLARLGPGLFAALFIEA